MVLWPHVLCSLAAIWLLVRWRQGDGRGVGQRGRHRAGDRGRPAVARAGGADPAAGLRRRGRARRRGARVAAAHRRAAPVPLAVARRWRARWWPSSSSTGCSPTSRAAAAPRASRPRCRGPSSAGASCPGWSAARGRADTLGGAVVPATWVTVASWLLVRRGRRAAALARRPRPPVGPRRAGRLRRAPTSRCCSPVASGFGQIIGLDPRYSSDTLHAAVVCVALCLRGAVLAGYWPRRRRAARWWSAALLASYGVASAFGTALLVPHFQNTRGPRLRHQPPRRPGRRPDPGHRRRPGARGARAAAGRRRQPLLRHLRAAAGAARLRRAVARGSGWWGPDGRLQPGRAGRLGAERRRARTTTAATRCRRRPGDVELAVPVDGRLLLRVRYYSGAEATVR